jgi:Holliday junction DNA helicase RuvA
MIGYLKGKVVYSDAKKIIILGADGVGREVNFSYFADLNSELEIFVHHHITDSDQSLWGFKCLEDKKLFELLKSVNKVGSSKAYPLVTQVGMDAVLSAIKFEQIDVLTAAQGIGKKMAEQIILSLKDKIDKLDFVSNLSTHSSSNGEGFIDNDILKETIQALDSLGYNDKIVLKVAKANLSSEIKTSEELLKLVLKSI